MIGNPKWFKYRIFGWGLAPKTWQGWAYVGAFIALILLATVLPLSEKIKIITIGVIAAVLVIDVLHIMTKMSKVSDERENLHQLIIERNCAFAAIATLCIVAMYQAYQNKALFNSATNLSMPFDLSIAIVLGAMLLTKIVSAIYVKQKM